MKGTLLLLLLLPLLLLGQQNPNDKVMKKVFIGDRACLYFIKPFDFDILPGNTAKNTVNADFTVVYMPDSLKEYVTLNVSILSPVAVEKLDSITVISDKTFSTSQSQRFFCEPRKKKNWESRFSLQLPVSVFLNWLTKPGLTICTVYYPMGTIKLKLPAKLVEYGPNVATQIRIETGWKND
jgi:hypothetical protein